jgi:hypothetical protein
MKQAKGTSSVPLTTTPLAATTTCVSRRKQMNRRPIGLSVPHKKITPNNYLELAKQHMTRDRFGTWSVTDAELQSFAEAVAKQVKEKK